MKDIWLLPFLLRTFEWKEGLIFGIWWRLVFIMSLSSLVFWFQMSCCAKWFRSFENLHNALKKKSREVPSISTMDELEEVGTNKWTRVEWYNGWSWRRLKIGHPLGKKLSNGWKFWWTHINWIMTEPWKRLRLTQLHCINWRMDELNEVEPKKV